jgi:hypothetical protein
MAADEELDFFHVTTYDRLPDIAEDGLMPDRGRGIGSAAYDAHRKGYVFLADADDLDRWHSLAERWAEYATDKPCDEDIIPVVLRVAIDEEAVEIDDVARAEGSYGAWKYKGEIEPEYLEVFTGAEFVPIEDWDTFDPMDACEWVDEPDLEEGGFYQFKMESVLLPDRDVRSNPSSPRYLSLLTINKYVPDMKRRGVSEVARSPRGFLTAYKKAGGQSSRLTEQWRAKRDAFIARHMAQVQANNEPLFKGGEPTRRHLALIAWAYSPAAGRL